MSRTFTFREHDELNGLTEKDCTYLTRFSGDVLKHRNGKLAASNYVGSMTTPNDTMVEILPKIPFVDWDQEREINYEKTRQIFLSMLRCWRRMKNKSVPSTSVRAIPNFPILEVFVRGFLSDLGSLTRHGLARRYVPTESNLPYIRGRLLFNEQIRENLVNQARFYVGYDELSVNRPANRLIRSVVDRLTPWVKENRNKQSLREIGARFSDVPPSSDLKSDWHQHHIDRSMQHYTSVMQWVQLFIFNQGLTTFAGEHNNISLMFPMEQVFQDFVTNGFQKYQNEFIVKSEKPQRYMATIDNTKAFLMKPDITFSVANETKFVLDAKWKRLNGASEDSKHDISQADMYQLYTYAKAYECKVVALIYPRSVSFQNPLHYQLFDGTRLVCIPFDIARPRESVQSSLQAIQA